ncbi:hypothetical protein LPJ71_002872 [Coemansia sp. S17]|nr:hypothetical protein LPJ71_002872 [Coemansia sp. S17]
MWCSRPQAIDQPVKSTFPLARKLIIELNTWSVCTDEGLEALSQVALRDDSFPMVRSVKFLFDEFQGGEYLLNIPPNAPANAAAFVNRILQMTPNASEIEMVTDVLSDESSNESSDDFPVHFSDLLAQLFRLATRVRYYYNGSANTISQQMDLVCNLVHLCFMVKSSGVDFVQLARQCAPTLQSLEMESTRYSDVVDLIQYSNGDYIGYPQLLLFEHYVDDDDEEPSELFVTRGTIPFPRLKRLIFRSCYPFGDDTPFRGNAATLETLSLTVESLTLAKLDRHRVFTPASHPVLRYVDTRLLDIGETENITTMTDLLNFSLRIGPNSPVRRIDDFRSDGPARRSMLPLIGAMSSIQVLVLPQISLTLWETIDLINSLPLLSDLHTRPPRFGEVPVGICLSWLPAQNVPNGPLMGIVVPQPPDFYFQLFVLRARRFRFWNILKMKPEEIELVVHCVLHMALLCPNFDYAAPPSDIHEQFMAKLEETIQTDLYNRHVTRLRRLLFTN